MTVSLSTDEIKKMRDYIIGIRSEKGKIDADQFELKRLINSKEAEFKIRLKAVQERCPHVNTNYTPDASGNNDSFTNCDDCGKYL